MATTILFSTLFIVSIFIVDILYGMIDPRIRVQGVKTMTQNIDKSLDDQSNAAMTHTSEGIMATDFVMRDIDLNKEPEMQRESKNFWQDAWAQLKRNKLAIVGMIGLILIVILAFIGPMLSHHDYAEQDVNRRNLPAKIPVLDKVSFTI